MAESWFYRMGSNTAGPLSLDVLRQLLAGGLLQQAGEVRLGEAGKWTPIVDVPELANNSAQTQSVSSETQIVATGKTVTSRRAAAAAVDDDAAIDSAALATESLGADGEVPIESDSSGATKTNGKSFYVEVDGDEIGPLSTQSLMAMAAEGKILETHRIRMSGQDKWRKAGSIPSLKAKISQAGFRRRKANKAGDEEDVAFDILGTLSPKSDSLAGAKTKSFAAGPSAGFNSDPELSPPMDSMEMTPPPTQRRPAGFAPTGAPGFERPSASGFGSGFSSSNSPPPPTPSLPSVNPATLRPTNPGRGKTNYPMGAEGKSKIDLGQLKDPKVLGGIAAFVLVLLWWMGFLSSGTRADEIAHYKQLRKLVDDIKSRSNDPTGLTTAMTMAENEAKKMKKDLEKKAKNAATSNNVHAKYGVLNRLRERIANFRTSALKFNEETEANDLNEESLKLLIEEADDVAFELGLPEGKKRPAPPPGAANDD